ncbi:MAG: glycosyltransferase family 4 protein [Gammaproteobacteria bacterium]|nr:glycosyltransferase family 4 protein [Gammaproteobacteria bacterium]
MRILQVHWRYDAFGGGEVYLEHLTTLLESAGHSVYLMTGATRSDHKQLIGRNYLLIDESGGIRSGVRELTKVLQQIKRVAPDVVHFHHTGGLLSPFIVQAIQQRFPTIKTIHDVSVVCPLGDEMIKQCSGSLCHHPFNSGCIYRGCYRVTEKGIRPLLTTFWERWVTRRLDRLLVSTDYMRRELLRNDFTAQRISILPLFTTMNQDRSVAATAQAETRLLFVGRLDRAKGGHELIDALAMIDRQLGWQADVLGEGPVLGALKQRIAGTVLAERIRFHGRVEANRVPGFFARARVLLMPSMIPESFGLVGIEAMACARPVVAFDSGGISDWLVNGKTGFLVERGNLREFARRIEQLLVDDRMVAAMGECAVQRVERLYRPAAHLSQVVAQYRAVCAARRDSKRAQDQ